MRTFAPLLAVALFASCTGKPAPQAVKAASLEPASAARPSITEQKMCAEQAKKAFDADKDEARALGEKSMLSDYTSHFDPNAGVCYVKISTTSTVAKGSMTSTVVYDAFERRVFATYSWINAQGKQFWEVTPSQCEVHPPKQAVIHCNSSDEFDALVDKWFGVAQ